MADQATTNSLAFLAFNVDTNLVPIGVKPSFLPIPTLTTIGGVRAGANITIDANGVISATGGGTGGVNIQVNGTLVPPANNAINFVDSTEPANAVVVENASSNQISFSLDVNSPLWATSLALVSNNIPKVNFLVANGGAAYNVTYPSSQGASGQVWVNDGNGNLTWQTIQGGSSGTVTQVLGTSNNITVSPTTASQSTYTVDLANAGTVGTYTYATITTDAKGRVSSATSNTPVTNFGVTGNTGRTGAIRLTAGSNVTITDNTDGSFTISSTGGGGGGGAFTTDAVWATSNASSKDAYTAPGVVNTQGINIGLIASSGSGQVTNATVRLNGVALANTYTSTGTWPNLTIAIPSTDLAGNPIEVAPSVAIALTGTFAGGNINIVNVDTLTNIQPVPFATTLSASYNVSTLPFYTTQANINYSYTNSSAITAFNGTILVGGTTLVCGAASGIFNDQAVTGGNIGGTATGNGTNGAGSSTVNLNGLLTPVNVYTPAFYQQTSTSTPPTFTTGSTQTAGAAQGSTITYPLATVSTQYNWIGTQRPLANILFVTPFGNTPLVPDVTAPTQTISGQIFNVYGFTRLSTVTAAQLVIT